MVVDDCTREPGTGQEVIGPDNPPDIIIAMNSIYLDEIQLLLDAMNCKPRLMSV
jgi:hypothetical protein